MKKLAVLFLLMCNYQVSAMQHPFYGGEAVYWARSILHLDVIDILPPLRKVRPLNAIGGILTKQNSVYKIFPNPTNDFVSIKSNNDIYHNIYANIFDGTGRLLLTKTLLEKDTKINLKDFCGGFYQIKIFEGDAIKPNRKINYNQIIFIYRGMIFYHTSF